MITGGAPVAQETTIFSNDGAFHLVEATGICHVHQVVISFEGDAGRALAMRIVTLRLGPKLSLRDRFAVARLQGQEQAMALAPLPEDTGLCFYSFELGYMYLDQ